MSILVASTLIINAAEQCRAAPQPVTPPTYQQSSRRDSTIIRSQYSDIDDHLPQWGHSKREAANVYFEIPSRTASESRDHLFDLTQDTSPHLHRRAYEVTTASGKTIVVPSALVSSIASSWDPRQRSVWFQRKAVIITSVFLAILIVLIIGAAAFIRDKREDDAEDEVDVSDETALKRMREEREMRKGSKKNRKQNKGETEKEKEAARGVTSSIVMRWARVPTRRLKKNRTRSTMSTKSSTSRPGSIVEGSQISPRVSVENNEMRDQEGGQNSSQELHSSLSASSGLQRTSSESNPQELSSSNPSTNRDILSVADVTAADAEVARHLETGAVDTPTYAFPPAYIDSNARSGNALTRLHPSADRRLAGSSTTQAASPFQDEKEGSPTSYEASTSVHGGSSNLPALEEATPLSGTDEEHYTAHIATDDKAALGRLQHAASTPAQYPSMPEMATAPDTSSSALQEASAPSMEEEVIDGGLTEEELRRIEADTVSDQKGKKAAAGRQQSLLPAPPSALTPSAFSHFDMPYAMERVSSNDRPSAPSQPSVQSSAKEKEAAEEERQALALMESKPEDMASLPRYEGREAITASAPSAPPPEEEEDGEVVVEQSNAPSAPPL